MKRNIEAAKQERGAIMALVVVTMVLLLGAMALAIDIGMSVVEKGKLQNAADTAALAGVGELPESSATARNVAIDYSGRHNVSSAETTVTFPSSTNIKVRIDRNIKYIFAKALGIFSGNLAVEAEAETATIGEMTGVIPIGVEKVNFVYGAIYTLKRGSGACSQNGSPGICSNFGPLALGGTGAAVYEYNISNGYDGVINAGDWVPTEPGNIVGPTKSGIDTRVESGCGEVYTNFPSGSRRLVYIPIIQSLDVAGRNEVLVLGFAAFFLEGLSHKGEVLGRFIRYRANGESNAAAENFNLYTVRLIK